MDHDFWRKKWEAGEIGFHEGAPNALLVKHFGALALKPGARVFLPLCGKTRDIHWLLGNGFRVAGAELSEIAVEQLFEELGATPEKTAAGALMRYSAPNIDIFQGDIFELNAETLGPVDAIYDRAALVALPDTLRPRYAAHLADITPNAPQLLIAFEYDQSMIDGPPFSIPEDEVRRLYGAGYDISMLERADVAGGLKGQCPAMEAVWAMRRLT